MGGLTTSARTGRRWLKELTYGTSMGVARLRARDDAPTMVILTYHSHDAASPWGVPIDRFERQVAYLRDRFRLVRLQDLPSELNDPRDPVACMTFDDGYLDNFELSLPVLERYDAKATFFLIASALGGRMPGRDGERFMTADHARELVAHGHEIGSHTLTHASLDKIPSEDARREIANSRRVLEDAVAADITAIAYPFGRYDAQTESLVSEAGYRRAVTTSEALVSAEPDWLALPRVSVNRDVGPIQFRAKLTPALAVYESWRGRR
jgi:peptidoglycan/xylan/chitin deacetylase (PgdA/CDA1 family)